MCHRPFGVHNAYAYLRRVKVGLHTILPLLILYGVWHTKGGSGGGIVYGAIDAQWYCNSAGNAGGKGLRGLTLNP